MVGLGAADTSQEMTRQACPDPGVTGYCAPREYERGPAETQQKTRPKPSGLAGPRAVAGVSRSRALAPAASVDLEHWVPRTGRAVAGRRLVAVCVALAGMLSALTMASSARAYPTSGFTIWTIAGTGAFCNLTESCGDGGPAISAELNHPTGVATDGAGNLYIADFQDSRIRKVSPGGTITTIAGDGKVCATATAACGDGGRASSAELHRPTGVAVDGAGNLYIGDTEDNRIRKVSPAGTITTIAGTGKACALPSASCGDGGPASGAELLSPRGVAVDGAGNLYIADEGDQRIRKVSPGGTITTIAGNGNACAPATSSCGDGGPASGAELHEPFGVAVDGAGNLYLADLADNRIRKVSPAGTVTTIAGTGKVCEPITSSCGDGGSAGSAELSGPGAVAVDGAGNLYISDWGDNRIRKVSPGGTITTIAGTGNACAPASASCGDGGSASRAELNGPEGVAVDGAGDLYIADFSDSRIRWLTGPQAGPVGSAGPQGPTGFAGLPGPAEPARPAGPPAKLVLVAFRASSSHGRVSLRYALSGNAKLTLTLKTPHGKSSIVARSEGHAGVGQIVWNGKLNGKRARHGRYRLTLAASAAAQHATSSLGVNL
jgi:sugar lactone lactonase YvrE